MLGELLFAQICLAADLKKRISSLTCNDLFNVGNYIEGHSEDKAEGVSGIVLGLVYYELGKRQLDDCSVCDVPCGAEVESSVNGQESIGEDDEALDRSEGYDDAFKNSNGGFPS